MKKLTLLFSALAIAVLMDSCKKTNTAPTPVAVSGCMDVNSLTYNSLATVDDGSCTYKDTTTVLTNVWISDDAGHTLNGSEVQIFVYELAGSALDTNVTANISSETVACNSTIKLMRLKIDTEYNIVIKDLNGVEKLQCHYKIIKQSGGFIANSTAEYYSGGGSVSVLEANLYGCGDKVVFKVRI